MWFFKSKKSNRKNSEFNSACSHCASTNTKIVTRSDSEQPDYVKTWRGQRYVTCRCLNCGRDFYIDEPSQEIINKAIDDELIADPEELQAAEEELKREIEDNNDRRCA